MSTLVVRDEADGRRYLGTNHVCGCCDGGVAVSQDSREGYGTRVPTQRLRDERRDSPVGGRVTRFRRMDRQ